MSSGWSENGWPFRVGVMGRGKALVLAGLAMTVTLVAAADLAAMRAAAEGGDPQAQYELGAEHYRKRAFPEAVGWWRKAAEQGYAEAQMWMSVAYFMGWGVPEDEAEGVAWLRKAAKRGHAPAQFSLGQLYELGNLLREDLFFAVYWFDQAAAQGHAEAIEKLAEYPDQLALINDAEKLFVLGVMYIPSVRGEDSRFDLDRLPSLQVNGADGSEESAIWWRRGAEKSDVNSQVALGQYLLAREDLEANVWFESAAERGHAGAQYLMSRWYWTDEDLAKGIAYVRKAAEQGHAEAQCRLGMAYWIGRGVRRDRVQSYAWFNLGSRGGLTGGDCSDADEFFDVADETLSTEEISEAQALSRELAGHIEKRRGSRQN